MRKDIYFANQREVIFDLPKGGAWGMVTGQIEPCIKCIHLRRHFIETWEGGGGLHCLSILSTESLPQARNNFVAWISLIPTEDAPLW